MDRAHGSALVIPAIEATLNGELRDSHLVALYEVVQAITRHVDTRETLPLIAAKARTLTGAESTAIALLDSTRSCLDFVAVSGRNSAEMVGQRVLVDDALIGHTALTGEVYIAENLIASQPLLPSLDPSQTMSLGVRSIAVVPIFLSGSSIGVLAAINRVAARPEATVDHVEHEAFTGVDLLRLQMLANTVSLALGQERLRAAGQQRERERNILLEAARTGASSLNVQEVLQNVLATIGVSMEMSAGAVFLLNDERTRLYIGADTGLNEYDRDRQLEADAGWPAHVLQSGLSRCINDTDQMQLIGDLPIPGMRSLLVAPLAARSAAEGLIVVGSRQPGAYSEHDAEMLVAVASHAAISLENAWLFEDATRRAQEATALYELSESVGATLQLDRVLNFVADSVLGLLHVDKFALFLHNERTGRLEIKTARNLSDDAVRTMQPRLGEGICGWVAEFETPTAVQDVAADHRNRSMPIDQEGVISLVSVPLQVGDRVIGVLHAMSSRRRLFTVGEMELLYTIANQVAAAIVNAQMYQDAKKKKDELRKSVRRVARALGSSTDLQKGAQIIADLAVEIVNADRCLLYTLVAENQVVPRAAVNFKHALPTFGVPVAAQSPAAWVARRGRSLMIADISLESAYHWPDYVTRDRVCSYLGVPLKLGKDTVGVLEVYTREPRKFPADEVRSLLTFASQASVGLKNAILVEQATRRMKDLDALNAISSRLYTATTIRDLCQEAIALVCEATQSDIGLVAVFGNNAVQQVHHAASASGLDVERELEAVDAALMELARWAYQYGEPAQLPSTEVPKGDIYALAVPVRKGQGITLAAIVLSRFSPGREFDEHDRRFLVTAANLLSVRLD